MSAELLMRYPSHSQAASVTRGLRSSTPTPSPTWVLSPPYLRREVAKPPVFRISSYPEGVNRE